MLRRAGMRDAIYDLWGIGGEYANKETFGLHLEIRESFKYFPLISISFLRFFDIRRMFQRENVVLKDIGKSFYFDLIENFIFLFVSAVVSTLQETCILPVDFTFQIFRDEYGNLKLTSSYQDDLISKAFVLHISQIFSPITTQKYVLELPFFQSE